MGFGSKLKQLREQAGLSQSKLAELVGISTRQISRLETGAQIATWPTVQALAKALGVDCRAFTEEPSTEAQEPRKPGRPRKKAADDDGSEGQGDTE